jgi:hypothetical protein
MEACMVELELEVAQREMVLLQGRVVMGEMD